MTKFWIFYDSVISTLASIHTDVNSCRNRKYHKMQVLKFTSLAVSEPAPSHLWQIFSESVNGSQEYKHLTIISVNINTISCLVPQLSLFDWWVWMQKLWRETSNAFRRESLHFIRIKTYDTIVTTLELVYIFSWYLQILEIKV